MPEETVVIDIDLEAAEVLQCEWCCEPFYNTELRRTDLGMLCDRCIIAIRSRGEEVIVYD